MVRIPNIRAGQLRIKSVRIRNFRSFDDQTVSLDPYTCFVGSNGAGKSTVLNALNVFFGEGASSTPVDALTAEDFHQKRTHIPVEIKVTFHGLSGPAQEQLKDYYRNGELIVTAVAEFDEAKSKAPVLQFGERMGIPAFADFFKAYKEGGHQKSLQPSMHLGQLTRLSPPQLAAPRITRKTHYMPSRLILQTRRCSFR